MKTNFKNLIFLVALILSATITSCKKEDIEPEPVNPTVSFTVSTTAVTAITQTTATTGGSITVTSGTPVITEKGVCYSTTANPTNSSQTVPISGSSLTAFVSNLTGLTANTTYHVRAYVIDNSGNKFYGSDVTFTTLNSTPTVVLPTVTTTAASAITQKTATTGGNITSNGNGTITASGVCYSTSQNPTTTDSKFVLTVTSGSFTCDLSNLTANTTYYVRAYATNDAGTAYGNNVTFTTLPTVYTTAISTIKSTTATSGGSIVGGNAPINVRGVCWSTSASPTIELSTKTIDSNTSSFSSNMTNLTPKTTYYVRAYATNSTGTAYGNEVIFTTSALEIGDAYQGGIIAYILKSGDNGYVAGEVHGLIAASNDQSSSVVWSITGGNIAGTSELLGYGNANTILIVIVNNQYDGNYAAKLCTNLGTGWYLPSNNELKKLYDNKTIIGGFSTGKYWTSTQGIIDAYNVYPAMSLDFSTGTFSPQYKNQTLSVRAIRSF